MSSAPILRSQVLGGFVFAGIAFFVLSQLSLHLLQPELNPLDQAISYYVHGPQGWLLTAGLLSLGVASLALAVALVRDLAASVGRSGLFCFAMWTLGVFLGAAFATDPPGQWNKPPSLSGSIHGIAAMVALASFPIAALRLSRAFQADHRWSERSRALRVLAMSSAACLALFFASLVPVFIRPGPPLLLGLTERILFVAYLAWLWICATGLVRVSASEMEDAHNSRIDGSGAGA